MAKQPPTADYVFENHGSVWLCEAQSEHAFENLASGVGSEAQFWGGMAVVVEPRYVSQLAQQLEDEGWLKPQCPAIRQMRCVSNDSFPAVTTARFKVC